MKPKASHIAIAISLLSVTAFAQTAPPAAAPVMASTEEDSLQFSGYLDASYNYLSQSKAFTSGTASRVFDLERNGFAIRQLAATLAYQPKEGLGGLVNVTAGKDADVINAYGLGLGKRDKFDLTQGFAQYATGPFTIIGGKYVTLAGAEVINSPSNANFSRSILFGYAIPFTHTGVRGTYAVNDTLSLMLGVNNGWDNYKDTNGSKTAELGLTYVPSKALSFAVQGYTGKERVGGLVNTGPEGVRNLIDFVGTYNASDALTYVLNLDYGSQENATLANGGIGKAKWSGIAGYVKYQINGQWSLGGRGEYFDDKDGYRTGLVQKWKEVTLTLAYQPIKALELRAEVRADHSNVAAFLNSSGTSAKNSQKSLGLQALYKF